MPLRPDPAFVVVGVEVVVVEVGVLVVVRVVVVDDEAVPGKHLYIDYIRLEPLAALRARYDVLRVKGVGVHAGAARVA